MSVMTGTIEITGIRLSKIGDLVLVDAEIEGRWIEVIRERRDGNFDHLVNPSVIRAAVAAAAKARSS